MSAAWTIYENKALLLPDYDDLPLWGFIGKVDKEGKTDPSEYKYYLFRHMHFDILYNNDRVIETEQIMMQSLMLPRISTSMLRSCIQ